MHSGDRGCYSHAKQRLLGSLGNHSHSASLPIDTIVCSQQLGCALCRVADRFRSPTVSSIEATRSGNSATNILVELSISRSLSSLTNAPGANSHNGSAVSLFEMCLLMVAIRSARLMGFVA